MSEMNIDSKLLMSRPVQNPGGDLVQLARDASGKVSHSEVAKSFEQIFVQQMVRELSSSLDKGFFGDTEGSQVYQGLFETFLSKKIAEGKGIGLASIIEKAVQEKIQSAQLPTSSNEVK